jgi:hypothetical protein
LFPEFLKVLKYPILAVLPKKPFQGYNYSFVFDNIIEEQIIVAENLQNFQREIWLVELSVASWAIDRGISLYTDVSTHRALPSMNYTVLNG